MQQALLVEGFIEIPEDANLRIMNEDDEKVVTEEDEDAFGKLGYTTEQIERIKKNLETAKQAG